jgi:aryl-alcohol dehydrogenase-like predicted oxidoreductase
MSISPLTQDNKKLVLGTALWGWGIDRHEAYVMLENFLLMGGQFVDTAMNYPINKQEGDFALAVRWIADWVKCNQKSDLALTVKVGSSDNMGSPDVKLSPDDIEQAASTLLRQFDCSLSCISIHWDNRSDDDCENIVQTVQAMSRLNQAGLRIGLSGIKHPELYLKADASLAEKWIIQVKENLMTRKARETYLPWFPEAKYLAYGINLGGLKSEVPEVGSSINLRKINIPQSFTEKLIDLIHSKHEFEPRPTSLNELAMAALYLNPALSGAVIGPRNLDQLKNTLGYWESLKKMADKEKGQNIFFNLSEDPSSN